MNIRSRRARWDKRCFNKSKKKKNGARWRTSMEAALIFGGFIYRVEFFTRAAWRRRRCEAEERDRQEFIFIQHYLIERLWAVLQKIAEGRKRSEWMMRWEEENPIYNFKTFLPSLMELAKLIFSVTNNRSDYLYFVFGWRRKSRKISRTSHRSFLLSTKVKKRKIRLKYSFDEILLMLHLFAFMIQPRCVCVGLFEEHKANLIFFFAFCVDFSKRFFSVWICEVTFGIGFQRIRTLFTFFYYSWTEIVLDAFEFICSWLLKVLLVRSFFQTRNLLIDWIRLGVERMNMCGVPASWNIICEIIGENDLKCYCNVISRKSPWLRLKTFFRSFQLSWPHQSNVKHQNKATNTVSVSCYN